MKFTLPKLRTIAGGVAVAGLLAGCTLSENKAAPDAGSALFKAPPKNTATVSGFAWDPEAFLFQFFMCNPPPPAPPQCTAPTPSGDVNEAPPIIVPGVPISDRSMFAGAIGAVFDPTKAGPPPANPFIAMATSPTPMSGGFNFSGIERRGDPMNPMFVAALPPDPGTDPLFRGGPPNMPQVPPTDTSTLAYLPTLTLKPIYTSNGTCLDQGAAVLSNKGILETVASFITINGGPATTPADFIDPTKFGGVAVVSLTQPLGPPTNVPTFCQPDSSNPQLCAAGVKITADQGTVYNINWAPPGAPGLPPWQSTRGFFVDNVNPATGPAGYSPMGISVVVLPAAPPGPPTFVQLSYSDDQAGPGHPWQFPGVPPMIFGANIISYVGIPGIQTDAAGHPNAPAPPSFVCLTP